MPVGVYVAQNQVAHGAAELCLSQSHDGNLRQCAEARRKANGTNAASHVGGGLPEAVQTVDIGCEEAGGIDGLLQNFDGHLAAVGVARKQEPKALPSRYGK